MRIYIEKYDPIQGIMLADFVAEHEFQDFCRTIDHFVDRKRDYRTMLWISNLWLEGANCPKEGSTYNMPNELVSEFHWIKEPGLGIDDPDQLRSFSPIIAFRTVANYRGNSMFGTSLRWKGLSVPHGSAWNWRNTPCGLLNLSSGVQVIIRNVGQANWNEVYSNGKCNVIYDIGASIYATRQDVQDLVSSSNAISAKESPSLIISHWDVDHYMGLFGIPDSLLGRMCCVFFPQHLPTVTSQTAYHLLHRHCSYLAPVPNVTGRRVNRRVSLHTHSVGSNYAFFMAESSTDRNMSGLSLAVWGNSSAALLVADHHYSQIERDILPLIPRGLAHSIVVPHHGGRAGKFTTKAMKGLVTIVDKAVISTGLNGYGHPIAEHRTMLHRMGFTVTQTDWVKSDILLPL